MSNAPPTGPTPLEPEVIILNEESAGNGKAQTLKRDEVKSREPSGILYSTSDNEAPPINPSLNWQCNTWKSMTTSMIVISEVDHCQEWNLKKMLTWNVLCWSKKMRLIHSVIGIKQVHIRGGKQETLVQLVFAMSFKRAPRTICVSAR